jgi:4-hydroxy-4-methyl-2-oxoglutarate aldolase
MFRTQGTVIGPAVTTKYEASRRQASKEDIRNFVFQPVDNANAGDVWVVSSGTDQILSMFGDIIALACKRQGLSGIVTDSGCRDINNLAEIGLPVFAKGPCLYGPRSVVSPVAAGVPVICGGVEVRPGDIVVADIDGVLVIPQDVLPDVARLKPELEEKEVHARRIIEKNEPLTTSYPL